MAGSMIGREEESVTDPASDPGPIIDPQFLIEILIQTIHPEGGEFGSIVLACR